MIKTEVKYTLQDELTTRLAAIEAKMSKFDKLLEHTDKNIKHIGKNSGTMFDKMLSSNGKLDKMTRVLNAIPNLNMGIASSAGALLNPYVAAGAAVIPC